MSKAKHSTPHFLFFKTYKTVIQILHDKNLQYLLSNKKPRKVFYQVVSGGIFAMQNSALSLNKMQEVWYQTFVFKIISDIVLQIFTVINNRHPCLRKVYTGRSDWISGCVASICLLNLSPYHVMLCFYFSPINNECPVWSKVNTCFILPLILVRWCYGQVQVVSSNLQNCQEVHRRAQRRSCVSERNWCQRNCLSKFFK